MKCIGKHVSNAMISPGDSPVFQKPDKYGLSYQDVTFKTDDELILSGWIIKGEKNKVIIHNHFAFSASRVGYTREGKGIMKNAFWTEDIHSLEIIKHLNDAGYTVLMYDMRNHGNSEKKGDVGMGLIQRKDLYAAVKYMAEHPDYQGAGIGLMSCCISLLACVYAFGMEDLKKFNLKAMVGIQPFTYKIYLSSLKNAGIPDFIIDAGDRYNKEEKKIQFAENTFLNYLKDVSVPTLIFQNKNDPMTDKEIVQKFYDDLTVQKEMVWADLETYKGAAYAWINKNPKPFLEWFGKYM